METTSTRRSRMLAALVFIAVAGSAFAQEAKPPASREKPVTTVRVGGSPADRAFRDAHQRTGVEYRAARAACAKGPNAERSACVTAAKAKLKEQRLAAKAAHDAAQK